MLNGFHEIFPDADGLLLLEPEELAGIILDYLNSMPPPIPDRYQFGSRDMVKGYPRSHREQISKALMEAWVWLEHEGFIAPIPGNSQGESFITRKGLRFKDSSGLKEYRKAKLLPRELLHPELVQKIWSLHLRGDHDIAIFQAFKEVEIRVREASGLTADDFGVTLMRKAFHPSKGPLSDMSKSAGERQAQLELFAGAIGSYKNPSSHRKVEIEPEEAAEIIILASHLIKIVDAKSKPIKQ